MKTKTTTRQSSEPKPGDVCPECAKRGREGQRLIDGKKYAAAAYCEGCGSFYGNRQPPPTWGNAENAHRAAFKKWLAQRPPPTIKEIEELLADRKRLYQFGNAPEACLAKTKATLRDELRQRESNKAEASKPTTRKKPEVATATQKQECGCLTVFDDFRQVLCGKTPYDLKDATQARALLRFLCAAKALSESTAKKKADILKALKTTGGTVANDWRPAHVFRGKLAALYRDAIGRNATKGLYWINP